VALVVAALCLLLTVSGCKPKDEPTTENTDKPVEASQVQATMTADATTSVDATSPATPSTTATTPTTPAKPSTTKPSTTKPAIPGLPAKVATFAKNYKGPVWYPTGVPKAFKIDMLDVVELEPGTGLVCDIAFFDGTNVILFTQGSAKARVSDVVSIGKVPWGTSGQADIMHEDPTDTTTAKMIVFKSGDTLCELNGSVDIEVLKAVAASMVPVK